MPAIEVLRPAKQRQRKDGGTMADRFSNSFREGRRDGERSYSRYGYNPGDYNRYGSERQRNYAAGWDEGREEKEREERLQQEREEQERQERRRAEERRQQEEYERQQYEEELQRKEESEATQ